MNQVNLYEGDYFTDEIVETILTAREEAIKQLGKITEENYHKLPYNVRQLSKDYKNISPDHSRFSELIYEGDLKRYKQLVKKFFIDRYITKIVIINGVRYAEISKTRRLAIELQSGLTISIIKELNIPEY